MTGGTGSLATGYLERTDAQAQRVVTLAALVAPAVVAEPELIRAIRVAVEPRFDTSVEADLWFSPLVEDRGSAGITLSWEVVPALLEHLRDRVRTSAPDDPVRSVGDIVERVHRRAPPLRVVQEKVTWASIVGDLEGITAELEKVLHAQRDPSRRMGISGWVDRVLRHMPEQVQATPMAWQLGVEASLVTGSDAGLAVDAPIALFDGDVADATASEATTALAVLRRDGVVELGSVDADAAFGIEVPVTSPIVVRLEWPDVTEAMSVSMRANQLVTVPDRDGPLRIRTLAGFIHEIGEGAAPTRERTTEQVFTIEMLPARNGTSLWIEYGQPGATGRILVDGGPRSTADALEDRLRQLDSAEREFELIISTHLDEPNSGGLIRLLEGADQDVGQSAAPRIIANDVWTNAPSLAGDPSSDPRPAALVETINRLGLALNGAFGGDAVVRPSPSTPMLHELPNGMVVRVLGPSREALERLRAKTGQSASEQEVL